VFVLAAAIAYATGTSYGTMAILIPVAIPLVFHQIGDLPSADQTLILALALSAVLDGAIFGDHCSPISDTTVMSSMASACDHIDHVKTQMPYAVLVMVVAGVIGYVMTAWLGWSPLLAYVLGFGALALFLRTVGRPLHEEKS
jgi:Na+/H+ antiporter NhaC